MDELINQISRVKENNSLLDELMNQYDRVLDAINPPKLNEMDLIDINVQIFINDFNKKTSNVKGDMRIQIIKAKIDLETSELNQISNTKHNHADTKEMLYISRKMFIDYLHNELNKLEKIQPESIKDEPQPEVAKLVFNHGINSKNVGRIEGKNFYINSRYCEYFVNGLRDEFKELYESEKTYKHTFKGNKDKNGIYQPYAASTFRTLTFKNLKNDKIFEVKQFIDENKEIIKSILLDKT